jgi:hypothetical protein
MYLSISNVLFLFNQKILELEKEQQVLYGKAKAKYRFINQAKGTQIGEDYRELVRKVNSEKKKH